MAEIGPLERLLDGLDEDMRRYRQRVTERALWGPEIRPRDEAIYGSHHHLYGESEIAIDELLQEPCGCWYREGLRFKLCERHVLIFRGEPE